MLAYLGSGNTFNIYQGLGGGGRIGTVYLILVHHMHKRKACHTERGKTKIEEREEAMIDLFDDGGGEGRGEGTSSNRQPNRVFLTYSLSKLCSKGLLHKNSVFLYWIYFHCSVFS
jgi:hypothetical protein